jgi:hypothetical protein
MVSPKTRTTSASPPASSLESGEEDRASAAGRLGTRLLAVVFVLRGRVDTFFLFVRFG